MKLIRFHYQNLAKHGVSAREVLQCLSQGKRKDFRKGRKNIYQVIAQTDAGRYLEILFEESAYERFVFHAMDARPRFRNLFSPKRKTPMKNHGSKTKGNRKIPPPPGQGASYNDLIAYFSKYPWDELEKAGYTEEVSGSEIRDLENAATFQLLCAEGLHVKLPPKIWEQLVLLAFQKETTVAKLIQKWILQNLHEKGEPAKPPEAKGVKPKRAI